MQPWQEAYLENARELIRLRGIEGETEALGGFFPEKSGEGETDTLADSAGDQENSLSLGETAEARERPNAERAETLKERNNRLLTEHFFPLLDRLPEASPEEIAELTAFGDQALDWKVNLDTGVYIAIHEALLRMYRIRRDRESVIRELYRLGMGLYYQRRMLTGLAEGRENSPRFENEMVFTEAASFFREYSSLKTEEAKGYVIRAMANIALCAADSRGKIRASSRALQAVRSPACRAEAPGLPWDRFERALHQQMSSNRESLSRGDLSADELSEVLDSCYEVFRPEEHAAAPSVRWLWPYYEMEYSCGYVNPEITANRLQRLIEETPWDQYDMDGLYGNVQLPIHYGKLMRKNKVLRDNPGRRAFLARALRKMERTLMTCPAEAYGDYTMFNVLLPFEDYLEVPGAPAWKDLICGLIRKFFPADWRRGQKVGELSAVLAEAALRRDPAFYDDLPLWAEENEASDSEHFQAGRDARETVKTAAIRQYAWECGIFCDIGQTTMNLERVCRKPMAREEEIRKLHPVIGHDLLMKHPSGRPFAEVALGHHAWYNGGGYPEEYERTKSPYRQMADTVGLASFLADTFRGDMADTLQTVFREENRQFSPLLTMLLAEEKVRNELEKLLK